MIAAILSERMKTVLALVSPPLILVSAAAISLCVSSPSKIVSESAAATHHDSTHIADINTGSVPMSKSAVEDMKSAWDGVLAAWWKQSKPIPWDKHCSETSRDAYHTGWYPLSCFMIPVERFNGFRASTKGRLSLGETQVYGMSNIVANSQNMTSDITVLDCRKGHDCKPTVLHSITMKDENWNVLKAMINQIKEQPAQ